jgi:hypothetical protein
VLGRLTRALRATGADLPFGDPGGAHAGVALESYFWRIVDPGRRRVVLAGATVCRDRRHGTWASVVLAALGPRGGRFLAHDIAGASADPGRLSVRVGDGLLDADADGVRVALGPHATLDAAFDAPRRWSRRSLGALGVAHVLPGLSQYWHPHLLGAEVRGSARLGDERSTPLDGATAYGEKNWGRGGFPPAWWWGQGFVGPDTCVVFAGGVLQAGPARAAATALVVRHEDRLLVLGPPFAAVRTRTGGGRWRIDARAPGTRAVLTGTAPGEPFVLPVPVPGERRTAPLSHQHQDGRMELVLDGSAPLAGGLAGLERGGPDAVGQTSSGT